MKPPDSIPRHTALCFVRINFKSLSWPLVWTKRSLLLYMEGCRWSFYYSWIWPVRHKINGKENKQCFFSFWGWYFRPNHFFWDLITFFNKADVISKIFVFSRWMFSFGKFLYSSCENCENDFSWAGARSPAKGKPFQLIELSTWFTNRYTTDLISNFNFSFGISNWNFGFSL